MSDLCENVSMTGRFPFSLDLIVWSDDLWILSCEPYQNNQHLLSIHFLFHIRSLRRFFHIGHFYSFYNLDDKHNEIQYLIMQNNQMIQCKDYRHKYCLYYQFHQQHKSNHIDQIRGAADICYQFERLPNEEYRTIWYNFRPCYENVIGVIN